jgi:alkanesulfonate monooxygenase SsuD/methylene tetrahydromethanopterin reductase-like flavin-dependent oxidoreductase (luciferase family)
VAFEMRLGIRLRVGEGQAGTGGPGERTLEDVLALARAAEDGGFDAVWVPDDPVQVAGSTHGAAFEAMTLLGALATATSRSHIGALATMAGTRPPALLAKQVTALDVLSGGRALLGLAAAPRRLAQRHRTEMLGEAVEVCRAMFRQELATVHGRHFSVDGAPNRPQPPQGGALPVVLAGADGRGIVDLALQRSDGLCLSGSGPLATRRLRAALAARRADAVASARCRIIVLLPVVPPSAWLAPGRDRLVRQVATWLERGADGVVLDAPVSVPAHAVRDTGRALCELRPGRRTDRRRPARGRRQWPSW